jgi:hypothetical protein
MQAVYDCCPTVGIVVTLLQAVQVQRHAEELLQSICSRMKRLALLQALRLCLLLLLVLLWAPHVA